MGLTISDFNREYYNDMIDQGYFHKQIVKSIPKRMREKFVNDLNKTGIESHFGMKDKTFFTSIFIVIIASLIFGLTLSSCTNRDDRVNIISNNVQSIGDIKINLDFKSIEVKEILKIKVKDSLQLCDSIIRLPMGKKINRELLDKFINQCDSCIIKYYKAKDVNDVLLWAYLKHKTVSYKKYMDMDTSVVLSNVVYCKFSIKNPYKKGQRIEMNRLFFFTPDNKKILLSNSM